MTVTIQNASVKAVISSKGAELQVLKKDGEDFIWKVDQRFWDKTSPVLFPIVGALKNDQYSFLGNTYSLPRHGFAREMDFQLVSSTENTAQFSLKSNEKTRQMFPFDFELLIDYEIIGTELKVHYAVRNSSHSEIYFSLGAHPAFAVPGNFEDYSLQFDSEEVLTTHGLSNNLLSGSTQKITTDRGILPLNYGVFEKDALIFKNFSIQSLLLLHKNQPKLKVKFSDFPFLGIWTKTNAPFLCIEPWFGIADHQNSSGNIVEKEGICILEAHQNFSVGWSVEFF